MRENEISGQIVAAAIEVHKTLGGPGLLESVYEEAPTYELTQSGIKLERQKLLPINYKGTQLATPLRIDMVVGNLVIVECKAVEGHNKLFEAHALTYLRLTGLKWRLSSISMNVWSSRESNALSIISSFLCDSLRPLRLCVESFLLRSTSS